jgi:hypothetical protein
MAEIPARRRMLESLLVEAMIEAQDGSPAAAADYATAVLLMVDSDRDRELDDMASEILRCAGVLGEPACRFD